MNPLLDDEPPEHQVIWIVTGGELATVQELMAAGWFVVYDAMHGRRRRVELERRVMELEKTRRRREGNRAR